MSDLGIMSQLPHLGFGDFVCLCDDGSQGAQAMLVLYFVLSGHPSLDSWRKDQRMDEVRFRVRAELMDLFEDGFLTLPVLSRYRTV